MKREDCIQIGYISKAHGVQGELRAVFDVYDIREYRKVKTLWGGKRDKPMDELTLTSFKTQQKMEVLIRLDGVTDRNQAEDMVGTTLYIPEAQLPNLPEGHFYYFEVIGFDVVDTNLGKLGTVKDFADGNAHDILMMTYQGHEVLIPVTDEFVGKADMEARTIETTLPEGLLEAYMGDGGEENE